MKVTTILVTELGERGEPTRISKRYTGGMLGCMSSYVQNTKVIFRHALSSFRIISQMRMFGLND